MTIETEQRSATQGGMPGAAPGALVDEQRLIVLARSGDGEAFLRLYRLHASHMFGVCLRILADETLAKDAAQQALIDAWQHLSGFRSEAPFSAWIHRIAVHAALGLLRSEKRMGMRVQFSEAAEGHRSNGEAGYIGNRSPGRGADAQGDAIDLEEAIRLLAPQMRTVLVLHDIEGYRHEEIGTMLNIAPGTSKAHLHRARTLVKEWLNQ